MTSGPYPTSVTAARSLRTSKPSLAKRDGIATVAFAKSSV